MKIELRRVYIAVNHLRDPVLRHDYEALIWSWDGANNAVEFGTLEDEAPIGYVQGLCHWRIDGFRETSEALSRALGREGVHKMMADVEAARANRQARV